MFDVLVVREVDRLARNLAKQLVIEAEFKASGVTIEYVMREYPDTPEDTLMKQIRASIAEYERALIAIRLARGRRLKAKAGNVILNGAAPFVYREVEQDGKRVLVIDETEARQSSA